MSVMNADANLDAGYEYLGYMEKLYINANMTALAKHRPSICKQGGDVVLLFGIPS